MEVSGQVYTPAVLSTGKEPSVSIGEGTFQKLFLLKRFAK
jgi:hypothetical protein